MPVTIDVAGILLTTIVIHAFSILFQYCNYFDKVVRW
jgi:hypothetical protein